jgi:hypothetical protein
MGVYIIDTFFKLFYKIIRGKWYELTNERLFIKSYMIDVFGNYMFSEFWNCTLSVGGYKFGRFGETMSSVFGKKLAEATLSPAGYLLAYYLDLLFVTDWENGGHCSASILNDSQIENFLNLRDC